MTLSEDYAWVRYLHALTPGPRLQIPHPFPELDAHQKTILSDDFGMGIAIYWARDKLGLRDASPLRGQPEAPASVTGEWPVERSMGSGAGIPNTTFATETLEADELGRTEVKGGLFSSELSVGRRDGGVPVTVTVPTPSSGPKKKLRVKE